MVLNYVPILLDFIELYTQFHNGYLVLSEIQSGGSAFNFNFNSKSRRVPIINFISIIIVSNFKIHF